MMILINFIAYAHDAGLHYFAPCVCLVIITMILITYAHDVGLAAGHVRTCTV